MVSVQTLILCSNAPILWNGCCGWRKRDRQPAVTTVSDASRESMMLMWHSRVHSGVITQSGIYWPHLLHKNGYRKRNNGTTHRWAVSASTLSDPSSMYTLTRLSAHSSSVSYLETCQRGTENEEIILIWQNGTRDPLWELQKKLIRALPLWPCW